MEAVQLQLSRLIDELVAVIRKHSQLIYGHDSTYLLPPPATENAIRTFEYCRCIRFPVVYHSFLLLHNGWENYAYDYTLIGVSGAHTEASMRDIVQTVQIVEDEWKETYGEPTAAKIREFETSGDNVNLLEQHWTPYVPNKIHIGTDFNGGPIFFDPELIGPDREMEVFRWSTDGGTIGRYVNFVEMLTADLSNLKAEIELERGSKG